MTDQNKDRRMRADRILPGNEPTSRKSGTSVFLPRYDLMENGNKAVKEQIPHNQPDLKIDRAKSGTSSRYDLNPDRRSKSKQASDGLLSFQNIDEKIKAKDFRSAEILSKLLSQQKMMVMWDGSRPQSGANGVILVPETSFNLLSRLVRKNRMSSLLK